LPTEYDLCFTVDSRQHLVCRLSFVSDPNHLVTKSVTYYIFSNSYIGQRESIVPASSVLKDASMLSFAPFFKDSYTYHHFLQNMPSCENCGAFMKKNLLLHLRKNSICNAAMQKRLAGNIPNIVELLPQGKPQTAVIVPQ